MAETQPDPKQEYKERYEAQKQRGVKFFPDIIYKDMIVAFGIFVILVILATFIGVNPEPPADPSDANYIPRPEWYFLFLFQMLKYFPGSIEWIGTAVVPVVAVLALLLLPFYDRSPIRYWRRRKLAMGIMSITVIGILALTILALLGSSLINVIIVIGLAWIPGYARITRAQVLSAKQNVYVEAERSLGATRGRIVLLHILPNILAPLLILAAMDLPVVITFEAGLSFLGLGVRPPTPSWGVILSDGFNFIRQSHWPITWAGLTLIITTLGFTLFGETLRDVLDPRLSGTRGI